MESFPQKVKIDYKSLELPIGLRYYFFLNNDPNIFINGSFVFLFDQNSIVDFEVHNDLTLSNDFFISLGLGYTMMKKYSLEIKYDLNRGDIFTLSNHTSNYSNLSIIIGCRIF